ncbi:MAG: sigma-70 family RNA polymerase sigma factor [Halanaerobiales bacterium]
MEAYLNEIRKVNILSREEERELWYLYKKEGNTDSRQEIIKSYQPLVFKLVKQINSDLDMMMDLIQEGNIGLIDAVDSFDPERGTRFSTFALFHIRGRIFDYLKKGVNIAFYHDQIAEEYLEHTVENRFAIDRIKSTLKELPVKERSIIEGIYLADKKADTIAAEMEISLSYLYRLQKKAIRRLRGKLSHFIKNWK